MASATLHTGLLADRYSIDRQLDGLLQRELGQVRGVVPQAMRYAVLGHAQRIRPTVAIRLARVLNAPFDLMMPLAMSVELLHCASLIVDDLPCMDDSPFRRAQPAVHVRFDEATSVLAAFALVALATRIAIESDCPREYRCRVQEFRVQLVRTLDCSGLVGGQALDLHLPGHASLPAGPDISELKTVPLFRLAVSAGSVFADLGPNEEALLDCFGHQFGLAFQMTDDLMDGHATDRKLLEEKLITLRAVIAPFGKASHHLAELIDYLDARVSEHAA